MESRFTPLNTDNIYQHSHIAQLWENLEVQHNVFITLHDHAGSLLLADGTVLRSKGNIHRCDYCTFCRKYFTKQCVQHCRWQTMQEAARRQQPFLSRCYGGVIEVILPVIHNGEHILTAFIGSFRDGQMTLPGSWSKQQQELYMSLPEWHDSRTGQLLKTLEMFCAAAVKFAENDRFSQKSISNLQWEITEFFRNEAANQNTTLADLADKLHLSQSRTSHILQREFNKSFSKLLTESRIDRACKLLCNTPLKLKLIAELCGFKNVYYFTRVFRQHTNMPPGKYREQCNSDLSV